MNYIKKILLILMFSLFTNLNASNYEKLAYDFSFTGIDGTLINLSDFKNKVVVVVNVASRCGFTNQYEDLQKLSEKYSSKELIVIGVPSNNFKQEPGTNEDIKTFCETNFGIQFPITEKNNVIGKKAHPFFTWAKDNYGIAAIPKWNFHKIIINKNGKIEGTFTSITNPSSAKFVNFINSTIKN